MERTAPVLPEGSPPDDLAAGVLAALAEPALLVTADGIILSSNPAAAELFQMVERELRGRTLSSLIVPDDEASTSHFLQLCARSRSPLPGAFHIGHPNAATTKRQRLVGSLVQPASTGASALILLRFRVDDGTINRFALLNRQVDELESVNARLRRANTQLTEQRVIADRARSEAESANRAKSDFLAVMSHELRTPLNAIGGYVDLLALGVYGELSDPQRQSLERVQRAQRRLLGLINEVLTFAKLEIGRTEYTITDFPVAELLRDLEPVVAPQIRAKDLSFTCRIACEDVLARADRDRVEQIVINLLTNAIKFTPAGGAVSLEELSDAGIVRICVRDTGVGIPEDKRERIFEPFVQLAGGIAGTRDGIGLGLAICRDLARGMNGALTVESRVGGGSTFELTLPRACG